jgi:hypothetical protein
MIDYMKIATAVEHYKTLGYEYIEAPWLVGRETIDVTKPPDSQYFDTLFGHLVGSGEQSFIHIRSHLEPGHKYQCVTPCFRDDVTDEFHRMYFMKLELIEVMGGKEEDDEEEALEDMIDDAWEFFSLYAREESMETVDNEDGTDIEINGIEVGSYGVRTYGGFTWAYGTGVAEPRLSAALIY